MCGENNVYITQSSVKKYIHDSFLEISIATKTTDNYAVII